MTDTSFDVVEYERQHIIRLAKSVHKAFERTNTDLIAMRNLARTTSKYIENHKNTPHIKELKVLIQEFLSICDQIELLSHKFV